MDLKKDEIIIKGRIKKEPEGRIDRNNNNYFISVIFVDFVEKGGEKIEDFDQEELILIFWERDFINNRKIISVKEGEYITVVGILTGKDNKLFKVNEFSLDNYEEDDIF